MTSQRFVALAAAKFLSALVVLFAVTLTAEPLLRGHSLPASLRAVSIRLLVAEPLLLTLGFAVALWLLRSRLPHAESPSLVRCALAAALAVLALGVTSVFAQGSHLPLIISASVGAGLVAGAALAVASNPRRSTQSSLPA